MLIFYIGTNLNLQILIITFFFQLKVAFGIRIDLKDIHLSKSYIYAASAHKSFIVQIKNKSIVKRMIISNSINNSTVTFINQLMLTVNRRLLALF